MHKLFATGLSLALAVPALADWTLDNDASSLAFVSTKAGTIAEVHEFGQLSGSIDSDGRASLRIALDSVDTGIEIRDQRMRELLFETTEFPQAAVTLTVPAGTLSAVPVGGQTSLSVEVELGLHGTTKSMTAEIVVARLGEDRLLVASARPVLVAATEVGLADGVEKMREVAGLTAISPAVPVTFVLTFEKD